ncbi:MAG: polyphosphate polymerase domain-containing protein [Pseudomonadota bacterium]
MTVSAQLPPVKERYELKYMIPREMVEPITRFISPYCSMDAFSARTEGNFYPVNSLYFDTRGLEFLKQRLWGKESRFNMRARAYGNGDAPPYFLEIKHKTGTCVKKYRTTLSDGEWPRILADPMYRCADIDDPVQRRNKELFLRLAMSYAIEPKILTSYRRRAFFSTVNDYARVTMDIDLCYQLEEGYNLSPDARSVYYNNQTIFSGNEHSFATENYGPGRVILELKCNIGQTPSWMLDLVASFEPKQVGFSKYANSTLVARIDNGDTYMDPAVQGLLLAY